MVFEIIVQYSLTFKLESVVNMAWVVVILFSVLGICRADWVSEWMTPLQDQFEEPSRRADKNQISLTAFEEEYKKLPENQNVQNIKELPSAYLASNRQTDRQNEQPTAGLKMKLENTLATAKMLAEVLKGQIVVLSAKEISLKEAITNGRQGVSTVTVDTMNQLPRSYMIRDGVWSQCTGIIQTPATQGPLNLFNGMLSAPRCIGREVPTRQDPCVFNSVIKYETIPSQRRMQYFEDDYLCLRNNFNTTLEQYMSVPKKLINETCRNGIIRSLDDNTLECSMRVLAEYNFYPNRGLTSPSIPTLPLEYCVENDGSCKLIVAWHISNATIENFEFLKNEPNFKKYFITKSDLYQNDGLSMVK